MFLITLSQGHMVKVASYFGNEIVYAKHVQAEIVYANNVQALYFEPCIQSLIQFFVAHDPYNVKRLQIQQHHLKADKFAAWTRHACFGYLTLVSECRFQITYIQGHVTKVNFFKYAYNEIVYANHVWPLPQTM